MPATYQGLRFERLGHASVRLRTADGTTIYIDPWSEVMDGSDENADLIFVTHDDRDHYDPEAIAGLAKDDTTVVSYTEIDTSDLPMAVTEIGYDDSLTVDGTTVRSIPAFNDPDGEHVDADGNPYHAKGEVVGLLMDLDGVRIYFPSDTDFLPLHKNLEADVFLPPIGGTYTMDRHEAADFAEQIGASLVLPVHYGGDEVSGINTDADAFEADIEGRGMSVTLF